VVGAQHAKRTSEEDEGDGIDDTGKWYKAR
jgi:hypothetical protein